MKCPVCNNTDSKVIDSRPTENGSIRRRRECLSCQKRYTTYEIIDAIPIIVIKKDGTREIFDRNKIVSGLMKACYKRPVTLNQINELSAEVETDLQNSLKTEHTSNEIGVIVMEKLRFLDEVSYVRFASVYREFKDAETFMEELRDLKEQRESKKADS
ncbi:MAG: transcriptional regulator NrdR [Eubacteriales bacterium]|jgi:transcriptional repressor NrdR|nr:transcriptional regulator NrdR [Eubacteriales bacterium]